MDESKVFDEIEIETEENLGEETNETYEESGKGVLGLIVGVGLAAGAAVGGWWLKKSGSLDKRRIRKLENSGYVVIKPEAYDEGEDEDYYDSSIESE